MFKKYRNAINIILGKRSEPETVKGQGDPNYGMSAVSDWGTNAFEGVESGYWGGNKFPGGYGPDKVLYNDYWSLRTKSNELFKTNLYAAGMIKRLVTNEINVGLFLESVPMESVIGVGDGSLDEWTDDIEARFKLWGDSKIICDTAGIHTWGQLQKMVRMESIISGDILVLIHVSKTTGLPKIQLVDASRVRTPFEGADSKENEIFHGVEIDKVGNHVAYHILNKDGLSSTRILARGSRTKRIKAFLVYGMDKRVEEVRGVPLLGIVAQSLKDLDRYRDSATRKAVINSMVAMFIQKDESVIGSNALDTTQTRGLQIEQQTPSTVPRKFNFSEQMPGAVLDQLSQGEKPVPMSSGAEVNFQPFEQAIIAAMAWTNEIPPEIMTLSFNSNYSASQAAINEFRMYLDKTRSFFAHQFNQPIYETWVIQSARKAYIPDNGLIIAYNEKYKNTDFQAWVSSDWLGAVKPSTDPLKTVKASELAMSLGLSTGTREARNFNGSNFAKNMKLRERENEMLIKVNQPLADAAEAIEKTKTAAIKPEKKD